MKQRFDIKSLVLGTLMGTAVVLTVAAMSGTTRPTWDYEIIYGRLSQTAKVPSIRDELYNASSNGWDVVAATSEDGCPVLVLRRPK